MFRIGPEKQLMSEQQQQAAPAASSGDPSASAPEWEKLSESLVPITVVIMEETPVCVLHVTGVMFPDKKILDSKVFNPGQLPLLMFDYLVFQIRHSGSRSSTS